jgi:phosphatidylglycerophosphatase A
MRQKPASAKSSWRPKASVIFSSPVHLLAFGFGAGLAPIAPGTFGTLVAVPVWLLMAGLSLPVYLVLTALLGLVGCWICGASARRLGVHDYGGIVFDEIVGFLVTAAPLLPAVELYPINRYLGLAFAFGLFRLFDIWKPWPIGTLDQRVHGGVGIMLDDVVAGIYAALLLLLGLGLAGESDLW